MPGRSHLRLVIAVVSVLAAVAVGITAVWSVASAVPHWNVRNVIATLRKSSPPIHTGHKVLSVPDLHQVILTTNSGDVHVVTGSGSRLHLTWSVPGKPQEALDIHGIPGGEEVDFRPPDTPVMFGGGDVLNVILPADLAVTVDSDSGDIYASGQYEALEATSDSGDLHVSSFRGKLTAQADSGDFYVRSAVVEGPLMLKTGSGDISFSGDPGLAAEVSADSGDLNLAIRPSGRIHVQVAVDSGDVTSTYPALRSNSDDTEFEGVVGSGRAGTLNVATGSGDVNLTQWQQ